MPDVSELAAEVRAGARLAPDPPSRRIIGAAAELPPEPAAPARAVDRRGRDIEPGDPILFAAAGPFAGVYLGRYIGRDPVSGRLLAQIEPGEPRAGQRAAIRPSATLRARGEDIRAEVRAAMCREILRLGATAL